MTARVLLAMGRDGLFAHQAARVNAGGTPTVALLLSTTATAVFLVSGTFGAVLGVIALLLAVNYVLMFISLIVLRRREPATPRPYRAWGYPFTTWAAILIGLAFIVGVALADPHHSVIALAILLASYPIYSGTRRLFQPNP
jgi:APA family basic amino acid/polyamine antiporter